MPRHTIAGCRFLRAGFRMPAWTQHVRLPLCCANHTRRVVCHSNTSRSPLQNTRGSYAARQVTLNEGLPFRRPTRHVKVPTSKPVRPMHLHRPLEWRLRRGASITTPPHHHHSRLHQLPTAKAATTPSHTVAVATLGVGVGGGAGNSSHGRRHPGPAPPRPFSAEWAAAENTGPATPGTRTTQSTRRRPGLRPRHPPRSAGGRPGAAARAPQAPGPSWPGTVPRACPCLCHHRRPRLAPRGGAARARPAAPGRPAAEPGLAQQRLPSVHGAWSPPRQRPRRGGKQPPQQPPQRWPPGRSQTHPVRRRGRRRCRHRPHHRLRHGCRRHRRRRRCPCPSSSALGRHQGARRCRAALSGVVRWSGSGGGRGRGRGGRRRGTVGRPWTGVGARARARAQLPRAHWPHWGPPRGGHGRPHPRRRPVCRAESAATAAAWRPQHRRRRPRPPCETAGTRTCPPPLPAEGTASAASRWTMGQRR
jgi:hypothetical protein